LDNADGFVGAGLKQPVDRYFPLLPVIDNGRFRNSSKFGLSFATPEILVRIRYHKALARDSDGI